MLVEVEAHYEWPRDVWALADERRLSARNIQVAAKRAYHYWSHIEPPAVGVPWRLVATTDRHQLELESEVIWYETDHGLYPTDAVAMRDLCVNEWVLAGHQLRQVYQIMRGLTRDGLYAWDVAGDWIPLNQRATLEERSAAGFVLFTGDPRTPLRRIISTAAGG